METNLNRDLYELINVKQLLAGKVSQVLPYRFWFPNSSHEVCADNGGLEGFYWALLKVKNRYGIDVVKLQLSSIVDYLRALSRATKNHKIWSWVASFSTIIQDENKRNSDEVVAELIEFLEDYISELHTKLQSIDRSAWIRSAATYQILLSAFNPQELARNKHLSFPKGGKLLEEFTSDYLFSSFTALRWTGTYPRGDSIINKEYLGSPFSIKTHGEVDKLWGEKVKVSDKFKSIQKEGFKNIFELLPNHTSICSY
jgi:hypothetical protein